jgi:23S rRNA pseudouridine1911/1915/1917 synthase
MQMEVPATLAGERVDRAVALVTGWSRAEVQALVERRAVLVGGRPVAKSHRLEEGDVVEVVEVPALAAPPVGEDVPLAVVHEDADVVVVDKPAGLVVHPGAGHAHGTLVHGLLHRYPEIAGVGDPERPGIVHRLDRETSGLLVAARTAFAYESLVAQLAARTVDRTYLALVWGHPDAPRGVVDAPIGRSEARRTRMAVRDEGRPARTRYEVREEFDPPRCCLVECHLETGRTHQIRVHLAAINHPVVGDATYGGARESLRVSRSPEPTGGEAERRRRPSALERPFLHAAALAFDHPASGERVWFTSPLPHELQQVLAALRGE